MFHKAKLSGMGTGGRQTYKALNKCVLDSWMDKWMSNCPRKMEESCSHCQSHDNVASELCVGPQLTCLRFMK